MADHPLVTNAPIKRRRPSSAARRQVSFEKMVQQIADKHGKDAAVRWTQSVIKHQAGISEKALRAAITSGKLERIAKAVEPGKLQQAMGVAMHAPLLQAAQAAGKGSAELLGKHGVAIGFNAVDPSVVKYAREQAADLVKGVAKETKRIIGEVIARGAERGLTAVEQAQAIREVVGLPPNWATAPMKFTEDLRAGRMAAATTRRLSGKLKQQIRSAIKKGTVTEAFVTKMRAEYTASLINRRALNIARTETSRAAHFGITESWRQGQADGAFPPSTRKFWIVTPDEKLSMAHARIPGMNPKGRKLDQAFVTTEGLHMHPPSRPNCRCTVVLGFSGNKPGKKVIPIKPAGGTAAKRRAGSAARGDRFKVGPSSADDFGVLDDAALERVRTAGGGIREGETYLNNPFPRADFLPLDTDLRKHVQEALTESQYMEMLTQVNAGQLTRVPLSTLRTGQESVVRSAVTGYLENPGTSPPLILRMNGSNVIYNGNHRMAAELLRGTREVDAILIDLDAIRGLQSPMLRQAPTTPTLRVAPTTPTPPPRTPSAMQGTERVSAEVAEAVEKTVVDMGVDPKVITFVDDLGTTEVGKFKGSVMGVFSPSTGRIRLNARLSLEQMTETAAHEAQHLKFTLANAADRKIEQLILRDGAKLMEEDGVTAYSRAHWKQAMRAPSMRNVRLAVEETLAEIDALQALGRTVGTPRYRALLEQVDKAYRKSAKLGLRVPTQGGAARLKAASDAKQQRDLLQLFLKQEQRVIKTAGLPRQSTMVKRPPVTRMPPPAPAPPPVPTPPRPSTLRNGDYTALPQSIVSRLSPAERALLKDVTVMYEQGTKIKWSGLGPSKWVNGEYQFMSGTMRLATEGSLSTAAHELGHAIDHHLGVRIGERLIEKSNNRKLKKMVEKGLKADTPYSTYIKSAYPPAAHRKELFADIYAAMQHSPIVRNGRLTAGQLKAQFPDAWQWVADILKEAGIK